MVSLFSQILIFRSLLLPASSILTTTVHGDAIFRSIPLSVHSVVWISNWNHSFLLSSVFITHSRQVFTLPAFDLRYRTERYGRKRNTQEKIALFLRLPLQHLSNLQPACSFLGGVAHIACIPPPQFANGILFGCPRLISSLGGWRSRTMFWHCGDPARQLALLLSALRGNESRHWRQ